RLRAPPFRGGRKCSFKSADNATLQDSIFARACPTHQAFSANPKATGSNALSIWVRILFRPSALRDMAKARSAIHHEDRQLGCDCPKDRENRIETAARASIYIF